MTMIEARQKFIGKVAVAKMEQSQMLVPMLVMWNLIVWLIARTELAIK